MKQSVFKILSTRSKKGKDYSTISKKDLLELIFEEQAKSSLDLIADMNDLEVVLKTLEKDNQIMEVEEGECVLFLNH